MFCSFLDGRSLDRLHTWRVYCSEPTDELNELLSRTLRAAIQEAEQSARSKQAFFFFFEWALH